MSYQLGAERYSRLVEASRILSSTSDLDKLLDFIINEAATLTDAEAASILLLDPDTRELRFTAVSSQPHVALTEVPVPLDSSVAGTVFRSNKPLIIQDAAKDPRWHSQVDETVGFRTASILAVPMHNVTGGSVGVLEALNKREGTFNRADMETLSVLADLAGVAVERARLVSELRSAYKQLNELDQLKSGFIALASHELRTPLSIILGHVSFLQEEVDNPETAHQLDRVMEAAVRLRNLIQDMLNLRYVDSGRPQLSITTFDMVSFIQQVIKERDGTAETKNQTVHLHLPDGPLPIAADRGSMEVAVINVFNNAIKFTPAGGQIDISLEPHGQEAWLEVRDTGVGIPADRIDRVFTRFYQVEHHLNRSHEGLGLGLAVAKDLLASQGGRIWVKSKEGKGSQFFIAMPLINGQ